MKDLAATLRLLGDETRLRALRVLRQAELNGGELARVLGLAPSAASRQVAQLRDAGLVTERREGRFAWFRAAEAAPDDAAGLGAVVGEHVDRADDAHGDAARLADVLRERRERQMGTGARRTFVPGRSWAAWARALTWLVPGGLRVIDLGCGDGALALEVARFAAAVEGVDRRRARIRQARADAARRGVPNVRFRVADFARLPHGDASFDVALLSQTLHATAAPAAALSEAVRVVRPGGRVLVLDLQAHGEAWVRVKLGHAALGFAPARMQELLTAAGLVDVRVETLGARGGEPFRPLLATGRRPGEDR